MNLVTKNLAIMLFLLAGRVSFGQQVPIESFYVPGATWTHQWTGSALCLDHLYCTFNTGYRYKVERDTMVGAINYHLLSLQNLGTYSECPLLCDHDSPPESTVKVFGRIRVDGNKVFFTQDVQLNDPAYPNYIVLGKEYPLYDFDLAVGDTIKPDTLNKYLSVVDSITHLSLGGSAYTRVYHVKQVYYYGEVFIAGIGSSHGLLPGYTWKLTQYNVPQYHPEQDVSICYSNPSISFHFRGYYTVKDALLENCFDIRVLETHAPDSKANEEVSVYPIPAQGGDLDLTIMHPNAVTGIRVTSVSGRLVYSAKGPFMGSHLHFDCQPGIYYVSVYFQDRDPIIKKVQIL